MNTTLVVTAETTKGAPLSAIALLYAGLVLFAYFTGEGAVRYVLKSKVSRGLYDIAVFATFFLNALVLLPALSALFSPVLRTKQGVLLHMNVYDLYILEKISPIAYALSLLLGVAFMVIYLVYVKDMLKTAMIMIERGMKRDVRDLASEMAIYGVDSVSLVLLIYGTIALNGYVIAKSSTVTSTGLVILASNPLEHPTLYAFALNIPLALIVAHLIIIGGVITFLAVRSLRN